MHRFSYHVCFLLLGFAVSVTAPAVFGAIKLPAVISDGMVLQRDQPIVLWGWAEPGVEVSVTLGEDRVNTHADDNGNWQVTLPERPAGGPYSISVSGDKTVQHIKDVLIGEVWLGSGQSNMQWTVSKAANPAAEIAAADFPNLRMFTVEQAVSEKPLQDVSGRWQPATPEHTGQFSAVGYYFSRHLLQDINVPVGFIHSSWGGTLVEAWMRNETLQQPPIAVVKERQQQIMDASRQDLAKFNEQVATFKTHKAHRKPDPRRLAGTWDALAMYPGYKRHITWDFRLQDDQAHVAFKQAGTSVDTPVVIKDNLINWTYRTKSKTNVAAPPLTFSGQLDRNVISGTLSTDQRSVPMHATRRENSSAAPTLMEVSRQNRTSHLYNGMIAPLVKYPIKGVIWYQGESNAKSATAPLYFELFSSLIEDWRRQWQTQLPFYFVQLANFQAREQSPPLNSEWAQVRDAQRRTLTLPATAMAVAIDIGEAGDIHPKNKQEVGRRLALPALAQQYNRNVIYSGPLYRDATFKGPEVRIRFDHASGLTTSDGESVTGFAVAGADQRFHWANARIDDDEVVVWQDEVSAPQSVRYGWGVNPAVNLVNGVSLPASPFRTDHW